MVAKPDPSISRRLGELHRSQPMTIDYRQRGRSGLKQFGGFIFEDSLPQLQGKRGLQTYREMVDQDATCGTIMYLINMITRQVQWDVERSSDHPRDREAAEFLQECMDDLTDQTFTDLISEIMTMCQYGFSLHEIIYKRRCGNADEAWMRSKYKDGRIGWRGLPIRAQETVYRWLMDDMGNLTGVDQMAPPDYQVTTIPWEKMLLFRTSTHKNSPEGRSVFRSAFRSWYVKRGIENIEAVGIERDLAGLPVVKLPPDVLAGLTDDDRRLLEDMKNLVTNIRRDEQEGVLFPLAYDENGNEMFKLELLSSGGTRNFDVDKVISRYDARIAGSVCADFFLLGQGQGSVGSYAMITDKTAMFAQSLKVMCGIIQQVFNRFAIPRLFKLNSFVIDKYPELRHSDVGSTNLKDLGAFIQSLASSGMPMFPNEELEKRLLDLANLPSNLGVKDDAAPLEPLGEPGTKNVAELHQGDVDPGPGEPQSPKAVLPGATPSAVGVAAPTAR